MKTFGRCLMCLLYIGMVAAALYWAWIHQAGSMTMFFPIVLTAPWSFVGALFLLPIYKMGHIVSLVPALVMTSIAGMANVRAIWKG